jgi:CCR4-NOT transcription complex subunit 4
VRVLQRNLVYCIGLTADIASPEVLRRYEYLGQYGDLEKISVNRNGFTGKGQKGPSFSVYITYKTEHEASLAILALNNLMHAGQRIHASFGTTKYCTYFLKKIECPNVPDCYFLHCLDKENEIDERDNRPTRELFDNQQQLAEDIVRNNLDKI